MNQNMVVKILKLLFISVLFLFILVTGISLFIPSQLRISRAANTSVSPGQFWAHIDDLRNWPDWNPFFQDLDREKVRFTDTATPRSMTMEFNGTTVGWLAFKPGERVASIRQHNRVPLINGWRLIEHPGSDSSTIQWYMDFTLRWYPWEKLASLMFERSYGTRMEQGLDNLKKLAGTGQPSFN
jgi:hypothetical protein